MKKHEMHLHDGARGYFPFGFLNEPKAVHGPRGKEGQPKHRIRSILPKGRIDLNLWVAHLVKGDKDGWEVMLHGRT